MKCEGCGTVFCWDGADVATLGGSRKRFCSPRCRNESWSVRLKSAGKLADGDEDTASCPSGKIAWPTAEAAWNSVLDTNQKATAQVDLRPLTHVYPCSRPDRWTDHWHTTSQQKTK